MPTYTNTNVGRDSSGRNIYRGQERATRQRTSSGGSQLTAAPIGTRDTGTASQRQEQEAIDKINQERIDRGEPILVGTNPPPPRPKPAEPTTVRTMEAPKTKEEALAQANQALNRYYNRDQGRIQGFQARESVGTPGGPQGPQTREFNEARQRQTVTSPILNRPVTRAELESQQRITAAKQTAREEDKINRDQRVRTREEYVAERQASRDARNAGSPILSALSNTEKANEERKGLSSPLLSFRSLARQADSASYYGTYRPVTFLERKAREETATKNVGAKKILFAAQVGRAANNAIIDLTVNPEAVVFDGAGELAFRTVAAAYQGVKFIGKKEVAATDIISDQFLKGKEFYPKLSAKKTVEEAQKTGIVYSSSPERFSKGADEVLSLTREQKTAQGFRVRPGEPGGPFAAPKATPGFTQLVEKGRSTEVSSSSSLLKIPTLGNTATINRIETRTARLPKQYRGNVEEGIKFLDERAAIEKPGVAFTSPQSEKLIKPKRESEVIIPGGSILKRGNKLSDKQYSAFDRFTGRDFEYYTRVPKVFGDETAGTQKVALRDYKNIGAAKQAGKAEQQLGLNRAKNKDKITADDLYRRSAASEADSGSLRLTYSSAGRAASTSSVSTSQSYTPYRTPRSVPYYTPPSSSSRSPPPSVPRYAPPSTPRIPPPSTPYYGPPSSPPRPPYSPPRTPPRYTPPYEPVRPRVPKVPFAPTRPFLGSGGFSDKGLTSPKRTGSDEFDYSGDFTSNFFGIKASKKQSARIKADIAAGRKQSGPGILRPLL